MEVVDVVYMSDKACERHDLVRRTIVSQKASILASPILASPVSSTLLSPVPGLHSSVCVPGMVDVVSFTPHSKPSSLCV